MPNTSIWKVFFLKAIASTSIIFIAVTVKERFDTFKDKKNEEIVRTTSIKSIGFTILATFVATMLAYTLMWVLFGFVGEMPVGAG
jgi:hypothetical protein